MAVDEQDAIIKIDDMSIQIDQTASSDNSEHVLLIEKPLKTDEKDFEDEISVTTNRYKIAIPELPLIIDDYLRNKKIIYLSHFSETRSQYITPLEFEIDFAGTDSELIGPLAQLAEISNKRLWNWTNTFDLLIVPPASRMKAKYGFQENEKNIFNEPNANELHELAIGEDGRQKRLSNSQIKEISKTGTFRVESQNFEGLSHVWRLTQLVQKGDKPANDSFRSDLSKAYYLTFISARDRIIGKKFSLRGAIYHFGYAFYFLFNLIFGATGKQLSQSEKSILTKFEFGELLRDIEPNDPEQLKLFLTSLIKHFEHLIERNLHIGDNLDENIQLLSTWEEKTIREKFSEAPFIYKSVSTDEMLNLFRVCPHLTISIKNNLLRRIFNQTGLYLKDKFSNEYLKETIIQYKKDGIPANEIVDRINADYNRRYLSRLIETCQMNQEFLQAVPGISAEDISVYFKALVIFDESLREYEKMKQTYVDNQLAAIRSKATIRSKSGKWLEEQHEGFVNDANKKYSFPHTLKTNLSYQLNENYSEWNYFIDKCESFANALPQTRTQILNEHLIPQKTFTFNRHIWNPKNQVYHTKTGKRYRNARIIPDNRYLSAREQNYTQKTSIQYTVTSAYPFWRCRNFFISSYTWFCNVLYAIIIEIILFGPLSISALFLWKPFNSGFKLDAATGDLIVYKRTGTLVSRVCRFWSNLGKRYQTFQARPDTGFIGKNFSRVFVVFYLFFILGFIGTILFVLIFSFLCVFTILLGILLLIFIWGWYPFVLVLIYLIRILVYDWNYLDTTKNKSNSVGYIFPIFYFLIYKLIIRVLLQSIISLLSAVISPLLSILIIKAGIVRRLNRFIWDKMMLLCVVKARGRVPITNTFIARRISGPGLAAHYYYQISTSQALIKLEYILECLELKMYEDYMLKLISMPRDTFKHHLNGIINPLHCYVNLNEAARPASSINDVILRMTKSLNTALKLRKKSFKLESYRVNSNLIKMSRENLEQTITLATTLTSDFYKSYLLQYVTESSYNYLFENHGFVVDDWQALAKFHLASAFSDNLLSPLEDCDQSFKLIVKNMTFSSYINNIEEGLAHHDLSTAEPEYQNIPYLHGVQLTPMYNLEWLTNAEKRISYINDREISNYHLQDVLRNPSMIALHKIQTIGSESILNEQYTSNKNALSDKINECNENVDDKPTELDVLLT